MAGEPYMTVVGNLAGDPELRFTQNGHAVANFTIAQTPRTRDQQSNEWVDDETLWVRCSVWREYAENVAESLQKGARVVAHGRLKARSFEDKQGNQRTNWEMDVDEIGPSLRWATAVVNKTPKGGNSGGGFAQPPGGGYGYQPQGPPAGQPQGFNPPPQNQPQQGPPQGQPAASNWQGQPESQFNNMTNGGNVWNGNPPQGQNAGWDTGQDSPPPF